jgi:hypothetical protein
MIEPERGQIWKMNDRSNIHCKVDRVENDRVYYWLAIDTKYQTLTSRWYGSFLYGYRYYPHHPGNRLFNSPLYKAIKGIDNV